LIRLAIHQEIFNNLITDGTVTLGRIVNDPDGDVGVLEGEQEIIRLILDVGDWTTFTIILAADGDFQLQLCNGLRVIRDSACRKHHVVSTLSMEVWDETVSNHTASVFTAIATAFSE